MNGTAIAPGTAEIHIITDIKVKFQGKNKRK